ncbi:MAG TPA: hypothetical protein VK978_03455 [Candidatus Saccharimonadales bacterium]|nr:hypothetical protein [Candidatus Saccharimonadales bacterium]
MTRVLSELLGAAPDQSHFLLGLQQLERSAGRPNHDIRLSTEIRRGMQAKLRQLHLDAQDTTGRELYAALGVRLQQDEDRFVAALHRVSGKAAPTDLTAAVAFALAGELAGQTCYALKTSVARRLLKANLPKKTMKILGYRSIDSMLKQETVASLFAAAWTVESEAWARKTIAAYTKLTATDFENRKLQIEYPASKRWTAVGEAAVSRRQHNILTFKELGSVVLLPLPAAGRRPELVALTTATLAIHGVNDIVAAGTYLKLHQASSQFGALVRDVILGEPALADHLLDQPVSWNLIQQYYARFSAVVRTDVWEPFVAAEDLVWHTAEDVLARIEPSLGFWQGTAHVGHLHQTEVVSCNLTDNLLSHCNSLPFGQRFNQYFRSTLMTELLMRYLDQERLERSLSVVTQRQFAVEPATA